MARDLDKHKKNKHKQKDTQNCVVMHIPTGYPLWQHVLDCNMMEQSCCIVRSTAGREIGCRHNVPWLFSKRRCSLIKSRAIFRALLSFEYGSKGAPKSEMVSESWERTNPQGSRYLHCNSKYFKYCRNRPWFWTRRCPLPTRWSIEG